MVFSERLEQAMQQLDLAKVWECHNDLSESLYLAPAIQQTVDWAIDMLNRGWDAVRVRGALETQLVRLKEMKRLDNEDERIIRQALKSKLPSLFGSDIS